MWYCFQVKIHMKVHGREDTSGLGSTSGLCGPGGLVGLGGVGASGLGVGPHHSMPPIFPPFSDHNSSRSASHLSSDSHNNLDPHLSSMNLDSDNECSSELADSDYHMRHDQSMSSIDRLSPRHSNNSSLTYKGAAVNNAAALNSLVTNSNNTNSHNFSNNSSSGSYVSGSSNNKLAQISPSSPESPTIISSPTPLMCLTNSSAQDHNTSVSSAPDEKRINASLKESYHLGSSTLKKWYLAYGETNGYHWNICRAKCVMFDWLKWV